MTSCEDLSRQHQPLTDLFMQPTTRDQWSDHAISRPQLDHFEKHGFVSGIPVLQPEQVEVFREQLSRLMDPSHPGNSLFYEFHSNESNDPDTVLFHALGGDYFPSPDSPET